MKAFVYIVCMCVCVVCVSCNGMHCISVSGEYQGVEGDIQYCYKTRDAGIAVFENNGKKAYLIEEDRIKRAVENMQKQSNTGNVSIKAKEKQPNPLYTFLKLTK